MTEPKRAKALPRLMYMHTLDGKPATWDGKNVVVAGTSPAKLYSDMRPLLRHCSLDARFGVKSRQKVTFGWCVVEVPVRV